MACVSKTFGHFTICYTSIFKNLKKKTKTKPTPSSSLGIKPNLLPGVFKGPREPAPPPFRGDSRTLPRSPGLPSSPPSAFLRRDPRCRSSPTGVISSLHSFPLAHLSQTVMLLLRAVFICLLCVFFHETRDWARLAPQPISGSQRYVWYTEGTQHSLWDHSVCPLATGLCFPICEMSTTSVAGPSWSRF